MKFKKIHNKLIEVLIKIKTISRNLINFQMLYFLNIFMIILELFRNESARYNSKLLNNLGCKDR